MRVGLPWAAGLALLGIAIHLAVPFAAVQTLEDGATASEVLSRQQMADRVELDVPGAGLGYLLGGAIVLSLGGLVLALSYPLQAPRLRWAGALVAALGATVSLHGNALWVGRGASSLIHHGITGADVPAAAHEPWMAGAAGDQFWMVIPIGPLVMAAASIAVLAILARAWPHLVREERLMQQMSRRHATVAMAGVWVLLAAAVVPWVVQELPDDPAAPQDGSHVFFWSAYDILQKREAGAQLAQATNEGGLVAWNGLSLALQLAMFAGVAAVLAGFVGLAGRHLESMGQAVGGRLLENLSLAAVPAHACMAVVGLLGTFLLHEPNRIEDAIVTGLPLATTALAAWGLFVAGSAARHVVAVDSDLVADDFPEPVVYD